RTAVRSRLDPHHCGMTETTPDAPVRGLGKIVHFRGHSGHATADLPFPIDPPRPMHAVIVAGVNHIGMPGRTKQPVRYLRKDHASLSRRAAVTPPRSAKRHRTVDDVKSDDWTRASHTTVQLCGRRGGGVRNEQSSRGPDIDAVLVKDDRRDVSREAVAV